MTGIAIPVVKKRSHQRYYGRGSTIFRPFICRKIVSPALHTSSVKFFKGRIRVYYDRANIKGKNRYD